MAQLLACFPATCTALIEPALLHGALDRLEALSVVKDVRCDEKFPPRPRDLQFMVQWAGTKQEISSRTWP